MALTHVEPASVAGRTKEIFESIHDELGMVPNVFRSLANSPAVLEGFYGFYQAIRSGILPDTLIERIALTVSAVNENEYGLAEHSASALALGLSTEEIADARRGTSPDRRIEAVLQFARRVAQSPNSIEATAVARLQRAGYDDREISEIIATTLLALMKNYFTAMAGTDVDYPNVDGTGTW